MSVRTTLVLLYVDSTQRRPLSTRFFEEAVMLPAGVAPASPVFTSVLAGDLVAKIFFSAPSLAAVSSTFSAVRFLPIDRFCYIKALLCLFKSSATATHGLS